MISKLLILMALVSGPLFGKVRVVTTTTDLAWATEQIAGELATVTSLLQGTENPHYVDTIPDFIRQVADADVVCLVGLDLEVGWLPKVLARSGNSKVQPGGKGYCDVGSRVQTLEKPTGSINRSMGDVHPFGNPHFWLSPEHLATGSAEIVETLCRVDAANEGTYRQNYAKLKQTLELNLQNNRKKLAPILKNLKQPALIEYHREFSYLFNIFGLTSFGSIEEKPGISPSAGRIAEIAASSKKAGIKTAVAGPYAPRKVLDKFKELSGIRIQLLPTSTPKEKSYLAFQDELTQKLIEALKNP